MITYNHEQYITQAVASALAQQTTFDFEIVIGDDCSTDATRTILIGFQQRYPDRIRLLLRDSNIGMHHNLVQTLRACRGEYVALLEGDDYWTSPHKLQKQVAFLDSHLECAICFHSTIVWYEDGNREPWRHPAGRQKPILSIEDLIDRSTMQTCSVMFRNRLIAEFPPWFFTLKMADWSLHILNAQHGHIGYIDQVMGVYRVHPSGAWSSQKPTWALHETIRALNAMNRHLELKYDRRFQKALSMCYYKLACYADLEGDCKQARAYLLRSIAAQPLNKTIAVGRLVLALKLYTPRVYQPLRAAGRYLLRRARAYSEEQKG
jgi:glycosyltransferase involved in cell wall biosynthesis